MRGDVHAQHKDYRPLRPCPSSPLPLCLRAPLPPLRDVASSRWCRLRGGRIESPRGVSALLIGTCVDGRFLLCFLFLLIDAVGRGGEWGGRCSARYLTHTHGPAPHSSTPLGHASISPPRTPSRKEKNVGRCVADRMRRYRRPIYSFALYTYIYIFVCVRVCVCVWETSLRGTQGRLAARGGPYVCMCVHSSVCLCVPVASFAVVVLVCGRGERCGAGAA